MGRVAQSAYSASKGGIVQMTKALAVLRSKGVEVSEEELESAQIAILLQKWAKLALQKKLMFFWMDGGMDG